MRSHGSYYLDLSVAWVVRFGIVLSAMAILAMVVSGCSRSGPQDILPSMPSIDQQIAADRDANGTRNQLPHGGCDEKSDSSLRKPLG